MDIGLKKWTVSIGILRRKIYRSICYNIFLVIINVVVEIQIEKHVIQLRNRPLKSFLENAMQKLGTSEIWNLLCFGIQNLLKVESGIQQLESRIHSMESRI